VSALPDLRLMTPQVLLYRILRCHIHINQSVYP